MNYIPLNIKTHYELLSSLIKIDDLVSFALQNDIKTLGITDSNMFSCMEFYNKCKNNSIKPIIGIDIYNLNVIVYAKNYNGYKALCNIVSEKNINELTLEFIKKYSKDIIVCTKYDNYNNIKDLFDLVYIYYSTEEEKKNALVLTDDIVYMNNMYCLYEKDNEFLSYLELIKNKKNISDEIINYNNHYIKINNEFDINTTYKFSSLINIEFPISSRHIPIYKENSEEFLKALCKKGLEKRLNNNVTNEYINRLKYELSVICKMGFVDYFLIVYDFVLFAKKNKIMVGPGRGSAAGSLVSYALGITDIDPLKYGLIFERFLNPERITMPDIDVDFDNTRRDDVIEYVKNKYGIEYVGNIISFDTMLPKQVLREVGRILNIDNNKIDRLCKTILNEDDFQKLKENNEFIRIVKRDDEIKELTRISNKLCGLKKNTSTHAAGVVISDIKLRDIIPLYKRDNNILTGYSMEYIESLGLLKMDFLSIKNLNTIFNIVHEINKKDNIDINKIDFNDKKTLELFKTGKTSGVFQFESSGMINFLKQLKIDSFDTIIDAIALYRPGPREMIPTYIKRKDKKEKITYIVKELEPILKSTYGVMIYQEQVLEILRAVGGYSYAEADIIRRAMSKKKKDIIEKEKSRFISGVISKGYTESIALELYNQIIKFSNYGFNKSHSVVYSVVAFQMAYLKAHYPLYFMTYLLNMNKSSYKVKEYLTEAKLYNIEIEKISINKSHKDFIIENNKIVLPFSLIKNIATNVSEEIITEREKGPFKSFYDFMIRCYQRSVNKRVVISMIKCGVFDEFNVNKKEIIENFDIILNYVSLCKDIDESLVSKPLLEEYIDYSDSECIDFEIENYGFYLSNHPVTKIDREGLVDISNIKNYFNKTVTTVLLVDNIKNIVTKDNEKMAFIKLSDEYGDIEGVCFPKVYNRLNIEKGKIYKFIVNVEKRHDEYQLVINNAIEIR